MSVSTDQLLARLNSAQPVIHRRDLYYRGAQGLRFTTTALSKEGAESLRFSTNLCRIAVQAVAERINVEKIGAQVRGADVSPVAWQLWADSDMPMLLQSAVVDALTVGVSFLVVWTDGFGRPTVTVETAEQVAVERDPVSGGVVAALKRWEVRDAHGVVLETHIVKYEPNQIRHFIQAAADGKRRFISSTPNPLGVVPVVELRNIDRAGDEFGYSVIDDLAPLVDALNKMVVDMMVTSESVARPKRWATGVDMMEPLGEQGYSVDSGFMADSPVRTPSPQPTEADIDHAEAPFKDSDDMWVSEQAETKFGQLPGADMAGYRTGVDILMQQIMALTGLPPHMVGIMTSNPATAEALRASEVSLTSRAAARIRVFNQAVEWAIRLLVAIDRGVKPADVTVQVGWMSPGTRSIAQEADAAVKLVQAGVLSPSEARALIGLDMED